MMTTEVPSLGSQESKKETDEETFSTIARLTKREGWRFGGHVFQPNQTYRITLEKEGLPPQEFIVRKPYPEIFDATGKGKTVV